MFALLTNLKMSFTSLTSNESNSMKNIFVLILLLIYSKGIACDCSTPSAAIEFYEAEFVFTGKIIF